MHCINYKFKYGPVLITGVHYILHQFGLQCFSSCQTNRYQKLCGVFTKSATCILLFSLISSFVFSQEHEYIISHINKQKTGIDYKLQFAKNIKEHTNKNFLFEGVNSSKFVKKNPLTHENPSSTAGFCINPAAPISGGDQSACLNGSPQTLTATATVGMGETLVWYTAATGGSVVNPATFTSSSAGNLTLYAEAVSALACPSLTRTPVNLAFYNTPTINAIPNQIKCNTISTDPINFTGSLPGTTYNWTNDMPSIGIPANGSGDIASFTPTNTQIVSVIATFTVTPSTANCTGTSKIFTLTIRPTPTVAAPSNQTLCNNTFSTAVNFSGTVAGTTFTWTNSNPAIGLLANGSGNLPSFLATNTGTTNATATIAVTPHANGCVEIPQTFNITVKASPLVANPGPKVYCNGNDGFNATINFSGTGTTYTWTNVYNTNIGIGASGSGSISFLPTNSGVTPITATIKVTPIGTGSSCAGTDQTFTITVNPKPTVTATPTSESICSGNASAISISSNLPGTTFSWTAIQSGATGATFGTGASIAQSLTTTGNIAGTVTYTITSALNGCSGNPVNVVISVKPKPIITATPSSQDICSENATAIALSSNVTGTSFSWTAVQSGATGASSGAGAFIAQNLTATGTSAGTVTYTVTPTANGCTGSSVNIVVSVKPKPILTATPTSQIICSGNATAISLSGNLTGTTFSWTAAQSGATGATSGTGNSISQNLTATGNTDGTVTYTITPAVNGCSGNPVNVIISVKPKPFVTATPSSQTICSGDATAIALSSNVTGTSFSWIAAQSGATGATSGTGTSIAQNLTATGTSTGTVTYTAIPTANGCSGNPINIVISVKPKPVVTATPTSQSICSGNAIAIALTSNLPGTSFSWTAAQTGSTGATSGTGPSIAQNLTATGNTAGTTTYTITPVLNGCSGNPVNVVVSVKPTPVVIATPSSQTLCSGDGTAIVLSSNVTGTSFSWIAVQSGAIGATSGTGTSITQNLTATSTSAGTVTYTVTPTTNGCAGNSVNIVITVKPRPAVIATTVNQTICSGNSTAITLTSNLPGTTFSWTAAQSGSTGATSGSGAAISQNLTATGISAGTVTYTITPTLNACSGNPVNVVISVKPKPVVTATPASQTICSGEAASIALSSNVTGASFSWITVQSGATGALSGTGASIAQNLSATGTSVGTVTYTVTPTTDGCTGDPVNIVITVKPKPIVTATPTSQTICSGEASAITLSANLAGTTFTWIASQSGVTGATSGSGAFMVQNLTATGTSAGIVTYMITPTLNGCLGNPVNVVVSVNPKPTIATIDPKTLCSGQQAYINFSGLMSGFTWTNDNIAIGLSLFGSATGNTLSFTPTNNTNGQLTATITITPLANNCIGDPQSFTITIPKAVKTSTPLPQQICSGAKTQEVSSTASEPGATFKWSATATGVSGYISNGTGNIPAQTLYATGSNLGKVVFKVWAVLNDCEGPTEDYTVNVVPSPTNALTYGDPTKRYSTPQILLKGNVPVIGSGHWTQILGPNTVSLTDPTSPETVITGHIPGNYMFRWTISNGDCTSSADLAIVVNAPPVAYSDYYKGSSRFPINGNVRTNDTDSDGLVTSLTVTKLSDPEIGKLTVNSNGSFTYVAEPGYVGTQTFTYKITDADGGQDKTTVTLQFYLVTKVTLTSDKSQLPEGSQTYITPVLADPIHEDVLIYLRYSGTADLNDYSVVGDIPIVIKAGETTSTQKILLSITKDDIKELDETLNTEVDHVSSDYVTIGAGIHFTVKDGFPTTGPELGKNENPEIKPDPLTSPNGDGIGNEEFFIYNISSFPDNEVAIFNRWGNEVYRVKNYDNKTNAFRGKANSGSLINNKEELLDGVYYYLIYTKTALQGKAINKGYFIMKRQK